jgi:hypothetical protein
VRMRRGELDELEPHQSHGVVEQIGHVVLLLGARCGPVDRLGTTAVMVDRAVARTAHRARCVPGGRRRRAGCRAVAWQRF